MLDVFVKSVIFTLLSESIMSVTRYCEDGMENPSLRITIWHPDGRVFLFHPHTNNGFFLVQ